MLGIFIFNLLLYLAFYIIMKVSTREELAARGACPPLGLQPQWFVCLSPQLRSSEKILPLPLFCIVATAVVWAAALYFFFQNLSSWEVRGLFFDLSSSHSLLPAGPFSLPCIYCFSSFPRHLSSQLPLGEKRQAACGQHGQGHAT